MYSKSMPMDKSGSTRIEKSFLEMRYFVRPLELPMHYPQVRLLFFALQPRHVSELPLRIHVKRH